MLPLVIGDLVPDNNPHWEHFLCLLETEEIVFAQRTTVQLAAYLSVLVESYLREYTNLYEKPVTPKQHYMVHIWPTTNYQVSSKILYFGYSVVGKELV